jgi:hypothetical protein
MAGVLVAARIIYPGVRRHYSLLLDRFGDDQEILLPAGALLTVEP